MRERIQSGGCSGGGATSCDQSEADRGVRKTGLSLAEGAGRGGCCCCCCERIGKSAVR